MTEQLVNIATSDLDSRLSVYIKTYGCQMNEYDSEKLAKILEPRYQRVNSPQAADLILINTCSVRDKPEQKLYSLLGELNELKEDKPQLMIGVGGCVAQQEGEKIAKRSKAVDFVFGTHNLSLVPSLIDRRLEFGKAQIAVDYRDEWEDLPLGYVEQSKVSAFVSISRGCNKACTYCIVPTTRGKEVSRAEQEILKEVKIAVHRGAKEIVLLGQTVNSWGLDLSPRRKFSELLEQVAAVDGVRRIRFTSPHPQEVRNDFFELISNNPKVCRQIHMPLQSGSNSVLKAMNRNYKRERYLDIIGQLKNVAPDIAITTDIIVGFPNESEQDFEDTLSIMREVRFLNSYSFMFSPRPGTKAALMEDTVAQEEKLRRLQILQALQYEISSAELSKWVGQVTEVLVDGISPYNSDWLLGKNSQGTAISIDPESSQGLSLGDLINVRINTVGRFSLRGEKVSQ